jgi:O-antigen ligase
MKETMSLATMLPMVLLHSFFSVKLREPLWKTLIYLVMLVYLFVSLVGAWHRGLLATWFIVIVFVVFQGSRLSFSGLGPRALKGALALCVVIILGYTVFEGYFSNATRTIEKLARFTVSIDQSGWDKGRLYVQAIAITKWKERPLFGYGYEDLQRYLPLRASAAHNFFVTSLFHRGLVGTLLIVSIFVICYARSIKLWKLSKHLEPREALLNKILVLAAWLWIIPLMTQEVMWERYSTSIQYVYFGFIVGLVNYYERKAENLEILQEN